jgi:methylitaconate Delta-isomerase
MRQASRIRPRQRPGNQGHEKIDEFGNNETTLNKCEEIRSVVAEIMGIAKREDAATKSPGFQRSPWLLFRQPTPLPKVRWKRHRLISVARMTAFQKLHKAYAVTRAVCLGAAAQIDGTIVNEIYHQV